MKIHQATQAIVDLSALRHNLGLVRRIVGPQVKIMAAVKADAYGHGIVEVSRALLSAKTDWLGVGSAWEGKRLREAGIEAPILVLGPSLVRESPVILSHRLSQVISSYELAEALSSEAQRSGGEAGIHLKVDSGMGRLGARPEEALPLCRRLAKLPRLHLEGLMTHFAVAHQRDKGFTRAQLESFQRTAQALKQEGFHFDLHHAANSAAIIDLPESHLDMVRPGIMIYGYFPSSEVAQQIPLRPALTFRTEIGHLKALQPGESVSYGRQFVASRPTRVAILPVGYADGYRRGLSDRAQVILHGRIAPVIGVICMDMTAVDVTEIPEAKVGDEVILFGRRGNLEISAEQ
ncbi:MAG: alanine racemase, partial [candidate division NC10 bacterium]|nr:alanine racemase [candidate division NC10 bacterium]